MRLPPRARDSAAPALPNAAHRRRLLRARPGLALAATVAFALAGLLFVTPALAARVIVQTDGLNVREGPTTTEPVIAKVNKGDVLASDASQGRWRRVRLPGGAIGWVYADYVVEDLSGSLAFATVTTSVLNARAEPSTRAARVAQLKRGQRLPTIAERDGWVQVALQGTAANPRQTAWVAGQYVKLTRLGPGDFAVKDAPTRIEALRQTAVRRQPDKLSDRIAWASPATRLTYLGTRAGWHQVRLPGGQLGWVLGSDTRIYDDLPLNKAPAYVFEGEQWEIRQPELASVNTAALNLRREPTTKASVLARLSRGQTLQLLARQNGWVQVRTASGSVGWVAGQYLGQARRAALESVRIEPGPSGQPLLTIRGRLSAPAPIQLFDDGLLAVYLGDQSALPGRIALNYRNLIDLSVNATGVAVRFDGSPAYRVLRNEPGLVQIAFDAVLEAAELTSGEDRDILVLGLRGYADPAIAHLDDGATTRLRLRATRGGETEPALAQLTGTVLSRVEVRRDGDDLLLDLPSAGQWSLVRRVGSRLEIEFMKPGLAGKTIVIDPGHGGPDPGGVSPGGLAEKDVNLAVALQLRDLLAASGVRVVLTRETDTTVMPRADYDRLPLSERPAAELAARARFAEAQKADVLISVHANANEKSSVSGTQSFWAGANLNRPASRRLASALQAALLEGLARRDRGLIEREYFVLRETQVPASLVEIAFLTNADEEALLRDEAFRKRAARSILLGLARYFDDPLASSLAAELGVVGATATGQPGEPGADGDISSPGDGAPEASGSEADPSADPSPPGSGG